MSIVGTRPPLISETNLYEPRHKVSRIYTFLADDMTEAAFYKTLERFCQSGSLVHLTKGLYYKPKKSRFGIVPIREQDIVTHYIGNQKGFGNCIGQLRKVYIKLVHYFLRPLFLPRLRCCSSSRSIT